MFLSEVSSSELRESFLYRKQAENQCMQVLMHGQPGHFVPR